MSSKIAPRNSAVNGYRSGAKPDNKELTSEKIAAHLEAFQAAGGKIDVLGTTRVLTRVGDLPLPVDSGKQKHASK